MGTRSSFFITIATLGLLLLAGCERTPADGPKKVRWDRDFCESCRMLLSDRHYAAQILDSNGKYHLFDDPGEMLLAFATKYNKDSAAKLYVTDSQSGKWLSAREARYTSGHLTPMGFGFGANEKAGTDSKNFTTLLTLLLAGENGAPTPQKPNTMSGSHDMSEDSHNMAEGSHNMPEAGKHPHMQH
jgi:copper chaperone NosL